jgi:sugar lactone lactonase YvrE
LGRRRVGRDIVASRELTLVVDGLGFGEGLRWRDDRLWFSDFLEHRVSSIGLDGDLRVEAELDDRPSGIGWLPTGGCWSCPCTVGRSCVGNPTARW